MKKSGAKKPDRAKPKRVKKDDPEQSQRFVETAHKLMVDMSGTSFESALDDIANASKQPESTDTKRPALAKE